MWTHVYLNTSVSPVPNWTFPPNSQHVFLNRSSVDQLDPRLKALFKRLLHHAHGPGPLYLIKAMLPWILPNTSRAIVLDFDLLFLSPVQRLWDQFDLFEESHMLGLTPEADERIYRSGYALNGGVQLMRLDRMRDGRYESLLRQVAHAPGHLIGYLGDQTLFTRIANLDGTVLFNLSCRFNRQLNDGHGPPRWCEDGCDVLHGNFRPWKRPFEEWSRLPTARWKTELQTKLKKKSWYDRVSNCFSERRANISTLTSAQTRPAM